MSRSNDFGRAQLTFFSASHPDALPFRRLYRRNDIISVKMSAGLSIKLLQTTILTCLRCAGRIEQPSGRTGTVTVLSSHLVSFLKLHAKMYFCSTSKRQIDAIRLTLLDGDFDRPLEIYGVQDGSTLMVSYD
jgi:hypothetical protein